MSSKKTKSGPDGKTRENARRVRKTDQYVQKPPTFQQPRPTQDDLNAAISARLLEHELSSRILAAEASRKARTQSAVPKVSLLEKQLHKANLEIDELRSQQAQLLDAIRAIDMRAGRMRLDKQLTQGFGYIFGKRDFRVVSSQSIAPLKASSGGKSSTKTSATHTKLEPPSKAETLSKPMPSPAAFVEEKAWSSQCASDGATAMRSRLSIETSLAIICPVYPGGKRAYGGEFVMRRVEAYLDRHGIKPTVIEVSVNNSEPMRHMVDGIDVLRVDPKTLGQVIKISRIDIFGVHSMEKPVWEQIEPHLKSTPLILWVHGFEARDWRELKFNFTAAQLKTLAPRLDAASMERRATMRAAFAHPQVTPIFVSKFMQGVAEKFAGVPAERSHVIHNMIDPETFPFREKDPELRKKVLWIRSFAARNYSNDISRNFVLALSQTPAFKDTEISIFGDGALFKESTDPLKGFSNVRITQGFLDTKQLREQHATHGVMLVPSRWDSQGLTCGEAMAAGLVPLTSRVAALPEFVDKSIAVMADFNDHEGLVDGYLGLLSDPERFLAMSHAGGRRSIAQCGPEKTVDREVSMIRNLIQT